MNNWRVLKSNDFNGIAQHAPFLQGNSTCAWEFYKFLGKTIILKRASQKYFAADLKIVIYNFLSGEITMFTSTVDTQPPFHLYHSKNIKYWTTYKTTCIQNRFNDSSNKYCTIQTSFVFRDGYEFINKRLFFNYVVGSFIVIWALKLISLPSKQALKIK